MLLNSSFNDVHNLSGLEHLAAGLPVVVCVHGINGELTIWSNFVNHLVSLGRVVLTLDLFGRGYSDAAIAKNDLDLFVTQLLNLLDAPAVRAQAPSLDIIDLVGTSLGGAISVVILKHS